MAKYRYMINSDSSQVHELESDSIKLDRTPNTRLIAEQAGQDQYGKFGNIESFPMDISVYDDAGDFLGKYSIFAEEKIWFRS